MAEKRPFRAYGGNAPYVFISYSHKDSARVYPVIEKLFLSGFNIWYDQGIPNNAVLDLEIHRKIQACDVFVLFLSENSLASEYVMGKELPKAQRRDKTILYVRLDHKDYSRVFKGEKILEPEDLAKAIPSWCRECEKRAPAPIEVDLSQGIELLKDEPEGFDYTVSNGQIVITDFSLKRYLEKNPPKDGRIEIVIPDRYQGFPVIGISEDVTFQNLNEVKGAASIRVILPDRWESIGEEAFECSSERLHNKRLRRAEPVLEIHLPEQLKTLDVDCFQSCDSLKHIDLPYGLERIEECAFWECEGLREIVIPETVKSIGSQAFDSCYGLSYIVIPPQTTHLGEFLFDNLENIEEYLENLEDEEDWDEDDDRDEEDWDEDDGEYDADNGTKAVNLDKVFHIICVEGSAAHRYAMENQHFVRLISEEEMEEIYQAPLRKRHQEAMEKWKQENCRFVSEGMEKEEGPYGCVVLCEQDRALVEDLLWQLASDGYRLRMESALEGGMVEGCSTLLPFLSAHNVKDAAYVQAIAESEKPLFPLMLDHSPVPAPLSDRFIMHLDDRTPEDLLNEVREHLSHYGCRGNPREQEAIRSQYVDPRYVFHVDRNYDTKDEHRGIILDECRLKESRIMIPDEIFGLPVIVLNDRLFKNRDDITQITVGKHVEKIGWETFAGCTALEEITLPPSIADISGSSFDGCSKNLVFCVEEGSSAEEYAEEKGFCIKRRA
ncbi:MAG: leucine-rich repeat protein [Blautia sp.]|nr:leucine-rich repeat protein [Blautia sp.]